VGNTKQGNSLTHDKDFCPLKDFLRCGGREGRGFRRFLFRALNVLAMQLSVFFGAPFLKSAKAKSG